MLSNIPRAFLPPPIRSEGLAGMRLADKVHIVFVFRKGKEFVPPLQTHTHRRGQVFASGGGGRSCPKDLTNGMSVDSLNKPQSMARPQFLLFFSSPSTSARMKDAYKGFFFYSRGYNSGPDRKVCEQTSVLPGYSQLIKVSLLEP